MKKLFFTLKLYLPNIITLRWIMSSIIIYDIISLGDKMNKGIIVFKLKDLLAEKGIAKYKLHTLTNVNYDTIVKYCKGTIQRIPVEHLVLFCNVLDCNVEDIIEYAKQ